MRSTAERGRLFADPAACVDGIVHINDRCRLHTQDGHRVVSVSGLALAHYAVGDRMGEAYAMASLVDQGWALQNEVARAFGCSERTVRRHQRRFEAGGMAALGRPGGYPRGRPRVPASRDASVNRWKAEGLTNREIAKRLGITEKAVRKQLRRLGWRPELLEPMSLALGEAAEPSEAEEASSSRGTAGADPNLSGPVNSAPLQAPAKAGDVGGGAAPEPPAGADPNLSGPVNSAPLQAPAEAGDVEGGAAPEPPAGAAPNLSGSPSPQIPVSLDRDPSDRSIDRTMACLGLLDDAAPWFRPGQGVAGAGVLLALPALLGSGVIDLAHEVYGSLAPAFYGLRTTVLTLLLMALLRIRRPEGLKEHAPQELGRILGLDRAPEVKTLRRKLTRLASVRRSGEFGRELAKRRVAQYGRAMGFLYVDGHVRAYHGKRTIPKAHVARMRISMPATTDYWVNDTKGDPLFVLTTEADPGLVKMLPKVLAEVRRLVGKRRVTVVFDRGGWSPELFKRLVKSGFDILTYRKGRWRRVALKHFREHKGTVEGQRLCYVLADRDILLLKRTLRLRQVTRRSENGHQTPIVTSRRDLSTLEVAYRMFERWRQENFFKYLREEYALDALVDYGVEAADSTRDVPNPMRKKLDAKLRKARAELSKIQAEYGLEAIDNREDLRRTMRGFKIANAKLGREVLEAMERVTKLEKRRARVPRRVPVKKTVKGDVIKLGVERKHLTDLFKMVAYQAESDLVRLIAPHYSRAEDEGRTLIQNALSARGDIEVTDTELRIAIEPLSSPHRTRALAALCEQLNETKTVFPGTRLRLHYSVQPEPPVSLAFPGPRTASEEPQPDTLAMG